MTMPEPQNKIHDPVGATGGDNEQATDRSGRGDRAGGERSQRRASNHTAGVWGEWCTPQPDPNDANKSWYTLPSQTRNGLYIQVLAIFKEGFRFNADTTDTGYEDCRPTEIEFTKNAGPSGITYTIKVTASCFRELRFPDVVKTFEIHRDQGRLSVTNLPRN